MVKLLLLLTVFISSLAQAQKFTSTFDQLVSVNEQWLYQKDADPALRHTAALPLNEQELIQFHLQQTEKLLRGRNLASLSARQQQQRINNLNTLHAYWQKGVFPVNDQHQNRQPYFIDKYNTYCAVGYLMQQSGGDAMAKDIHQTQNFSYLSDISHPELMTWTQKSGLTLDELALIQPGYPGEWPAAIMEIHYNNTGADVNEYIEVHQNTVCCSVPYLEADTIRFYNQSGSLYKTLLTNEMQQIGTSGKAAWTYTFAAPDTFADRGYIELINSNANILSRTTYDDTSISILDNYIMWGTPAFRQFNVGESELTPANFSLTFCGYYNDSWNPEIVQASMGIINSCTILPITAGNFSYLLLNKKVVLTWETLAESNGKFFEIERSDDGINFTSIGKIPAGKSSSDKKYAFTDEHPGYINHYRLKQVDADGKYAYSKILFVKLLQANPLQVAQHFTNQIKISINLPVSDIASLVLYDFSGRLVQKFKAIGGSQVLPVSSLPAGSYLLQLITKDGKAYNQQVVK